MELKAPTQAMSRPGSTPRPVMPMMAPGAGAAPAVAMNTNMNMSQPPAQGGGLNAANGNNGGAGAAPTVQVTFHLKYKVEFGQTLRLMGSVGELGDWDVKRGVALQWTNGDDWTAAVTLPAGIVEYKYVVVHEESGSPHAWMQGNNCVLALSRSDASIDVYDNWEGGPGAAIVTAGGTVRATRESRLAQWAAEMTAHSEASRGQIRRTTMELAAARDDLRRVEEEKNQLTVELATETARRRGLEKGAAAVRADNERLMAELLRVREDAGASLRMAVEILGNRGRGLGGAAARRAAERSRQRRREEEEEEARRLQQQRRREEEEKEE